MRFGGRVLARMGLYAAAIAGVLALVEVSARLEITPDGGIGFDAGSILDSGRWVRHPFLPFAGKPSLIVGDVRNNAYGFPSPEFPTVKRPDDFFVVCLGEGTIPHDGDEGPTWPELLERRLRQEYPAKRVTVFNLGAPLATSAVSVVHFSLLGVHLRPDLVVVYHGCNELDAIGAGDFHNDHSHRYANLKPAKLWPDRITKLPRWMLKSHAVAKALGAREKVTSVETLGRLVLKPHAASGDPMNGIAVTERNFVTLRWLAEERGGASLFSTYRFRDADDPSHRAFNERLRSFFVRAGYAFVDQERVLPDEGPRPAIDGCEITAEEQKRIADHFAAHVIRADLLARSRSGSGAEDAVPTEFRTSLDEPQ